MIGYCPVMWLNSVRKCVHLFMRTFTASPTRMSGGKEPVDSTETEDKEGLCHYIMTGYCPMYHRLTYEVISDTGELDTVLQVLETTMIIVLPSPLCLPPSLVPMPAL